MSLAITSELAAEARRCWRCASLGIEGLTILPGNVHYVIRSEEGVRYACEDCFQRLCEEIEAADVQDQEGEGWKQ